MELVFADEFNLVGLEQNQNYTFKNSPVVIGRSPSAAVIIKNLSVSRNHCEINWKHSHWWLLDKSSSGTFINGQLIGQNKETLITNGDIIQLGPGDGNEKFSWRFELSSKKTEVSNDSQYEFEAQSQAISNLDKTKISLETRMAQRKSTGRIKEIQLTQMAQDYENKLKSIDVRQAAFWEGSSKSDTDQADLEDTLAKEKESVTIEWEKQKAALLMEIAANKAAEDELRLEVEQLKVCLEKEKAEWQQKLVEMKENMEMELRTKDDAVNAMKDKMSLASMEKQKELNERLALEEAQKLMLAEQLETMKNKLSEADIRAKLEQERFEKEKQEEIERSAERLQEYHRTQISNLEEDKLRIESSLKEELHRKDEQAKEFSKLLEKAKEQPTTPCKDPCEDPVGPKASTSGSTSGVGTLQDWENTIEAELQCSICNEPFINAMMLNCAHTFCSYCLKMWKQNQRTCPVCRAPITGETRALAFDSYLETSIGKCSEEFRKRRAETVAERKAVEAPPPPPLPPQRRGRRRSERGGRGRGRGRGQQAAVNINADTVALYLQQEYDRQNAARQPATSGQNNRGRAAAQRNQAQAARNQAQAAGNQAQAARNQAQAARNQVQAGMSAQRPTLPTATGIAPAPPLLFPSIQLVRVQLPPGAPIPQVGQRMLPVHLNALMGNNNVAEVIYVDDTDSVVGNVASEEVVGMDVVGNQSGQQDNEIEILEENNVQQVHEENINERLDENNEDESEEMDEDEEQDDEEDSEEQDDDENSDGSSENDSYDDMDDYLMYSERVPPPYGACYNCGSPDHWRPQCPRLRRY